VAAARAGQSLRSMAREFQVPLSTVQYWVAHAAGKRLDRVEWEDKSCAPRKTQRTRPSVERRILSTRQRLKERSALGEHGADAIRRELEGCLPKLPSRRTVGRILERHGVLDGRRRVRRPAPPAGWYLPQVAAKKRELDCFDTIEGLAIRGGSSLSILTGISLIGGLCAVWPGLRTTAVSIVPCLQEHWQTWGLPGYAQFDNDNRFTGPRQYADAIGRVIRLCLSLKVTPVFSAPNETGFQAAIESFNGRWQAKVWHRFEHANLRTLRQRSQRYVEASRERHAARIDAAPTRRPIPVSWQLNLQARPKGKIIYIRRTNGSGGVEILGHAFTVDHHWTHRLVRSEVDLDQHVIRFYALRRRAPDDQPLLNTVDYKLPHKTFAE
jgi:hypothetical protein